MKQILGTAFCLSVLLLACSTGENKEAYAQDQAYATQKNNQSDAVANIPVSDTTASPVENENIPGQIPDQITYQDWDKKIIRTAELSVEVTDFAKYSRGLRERLKHYGAYIAGEEQQTDQTQVSTTITIRVPVLEFDELVNSFDADSSRILQKKISSDDVSNQVVDTKARISAKKQLRESYLGMLKDTRNKRDLLDIQKEINAIQEDIESASGRVSYLSHQSAYSTIHLQFFQLLNMRERDDGKSFWQKLAASVGKSGMVVQQVLLLLVMLWPVWLIAAIAVIWWQRRKKVA